MLKKLTYIALFIAVIGLSEVFYIANNHKEKITSAYAVLLAKKAAKKGNAEAAVNYLTEAAEKNIKTLSKSYPEFIPSDYQINTSVPKENLKLQEDSKNYILEIDISKILRTEEGNLAFVFYNLSIF